MKTVTRTVLIADEGMMLTDGESYGKAAYLKVDGDPSKWREITEEEYNSIVAENEENTNED